MATDSLFQVAIIEYVEDFDDDGFLEEIKVRMRASFDEGFPHPDVRAESEFWLFLHSQGGTEKLAVSRFSEKNRNSMQGYAFSVLFAALEFVETRGHRVAPVPIESPRHVLDFSTPSVAHDTEGHLDTDGDDDRVDDADRDSNDTDGRAERQDKNDDGDGTTGRNGYLDHESTADLRQAYEDADGNISVAAERFDVGYQTIYNRLVDSEIHIPNSPDDDRDPVDLFNGFPLDDRITFEEFLEAVEGQASIYEISRELRTNRSDLSSALYYLHLKGNSPTSFPPEDLDERIGLLRDGTMPPKGGVSQ